MWFGTGLVAVALGGGGGVLWLSSERTRETIAAKPASAATDPVLVPRRPHPPQIVEPVAGVGGGATAEEQLSTDTRPAPPCGGKAIRVPVIDRGPYIAGREWDFTGATAAALGFPGLGVVEWRIDS